MDSKKGIRVKTKQASLVDNIVNFFKKQNKNQIDQTFTPQNQQKDLSPRSTTPRKKIFDKTPQKASKLIMNKNMKSIGDMNNKNMDGGYNLSFNQESHSFQTLKPRSNLSPSNRNNYPSKHMDDTQFNRLILDKSTSSQIKSKMPQKTFLSDHSQTSIVKNTSQLSDRNKLLPTSHGSQFKKIQHELEHYKKLAQDLRRQNLKLQKQNQNLQIQVQNLKKQLKSYLLSTQKFNHVQIINLQTPKSPFQKSDFFKENENQSIIDQDKSKSTKNQDKNKLIMKQSIPILPQTPNQFGNKNELPRIQQMSFMSSNLKNLSNQNSFFSEQSDVPNFNRKSKNGNQDNSFQIPNSRVLSPLMQKTVYDKTMKPQQRNKRILQNQHQVRQQITFSQTIGYLKGDQPNNEGIDRNKNPFEQMASQSNKFYFKQKEKIRSENNLGMISGKKNFPTRQWLTFNQSQVSQKYSNPAASHTAQYDNLALIDKQSGLRRIQKSNDKKISSKSEFNYQNSSNLQRSKSIGMKKVDQSKTYKFADFDINDEESSYVDFF